MRPVFERAFDTSETPPLSLEIPDHAWEPLGTLCVRLRLSHDLWPSRNSHGERRDSTISFLDCPVFQLQIGTEISRVFLRALLKQNRGCEPIRANLDLSHLKGNRSYHIALAWDVSRKLLECRLNGISQGDLFHSHPLRWEAPASWTGPIVLSPSPSGNVQIFFEHVELYSVFLEETSLIETFQEWKPVPLEGEGRTPYFDGLDLSSYRIKPILQMDFSKPLNFTREQDLFENGERVRVPSDNAWVLEGEGNVWTENEKLIIESAPANLSKEGRACHLVLWHHREYPADLLIEYDFWPHDSSMGLHILFFATRPHQGKTIFDLGLPFRDGEFPAYHSGELDGYQVSMWSTDRFRKIRRTSNLRKNAGFSLVACGDDLIAGHGPGPHRIRLLKVGGLIQLETNGKQCVKFVDDGLSLGPILGSGAIGLRLMQHSGRAAFSCFSVSRVISR